MRIIIYLAALFFISLVFVLYIYPEGKLKDDQKADKIVINKAKHELLLYYKGCLIATYRVSLSRNGLGKKTKSGDNLTPEGRFIGKKRPQTIYHKAIGIGEWDRCCLVRIHGLGKKLGWNRKFHRLQDWTKGCIALTNDEIEEIYNAVNDGVIIEINP